MRRVLLLVAGGVLAGAALLIPAGAEGDHGNTFAPGKKFSGSVSPTTIQVTCAAGATTGTVTGGVTVRALHNNSNTGPGSVSSADQIIVTWTDGTGSVTLTEFNTDGTTPSTATFPCPPTSSATTTGTFTFQPYKSSNNATVGTATSVTVTYQRVGSAS